METNRLFYYLFKGISWTCIGIIFYQIFCMKGI